MEIVGGAKGAIVGLVDITRAVRVEEAVGDNFVVVRRLRRSLDRERRGSRLNGSSRDALRWFRNGTRRPRKGNPLASAPTYGMSSPNSATRSERRAMQAVGRPHLATREILRRSSPRTSASDSAAALDPRASWIWRLRRGGFRERAACAPRASSSPAGGSRGAGRRCARGRRPSPAPFRAAPSTSSPRRRGADGRPPRPCAGAACRTSRLLRSCRARTGLPRSWPAPPRWSAPLIRSDACCSAIRRMLCASRRALSVISWAAVSAASMIAFTLSPTDGWATACSSAGRSLIDPPLFEPQGRRG